MKTLLILRHAEAAPGADDFSRPLTLSGREDAARLGELMRDNNLQPDHVFCSPARRTRETLAALALDDVTPNFLDSLYNASIGDLLTAFHAAPDSAQTILMVGHNPGIHGLSVTLAGAGTPENLRRLSLSYDPGTLTVLSYDGAWGTLAPQTALLRDVLTPPFEG